MSSLTEHPHQNMPGYHFARIVAAALRLDDPVQRQQVIDSARMLLERGDR
jgi:predicted RNA binding protein with dsRBD fold (UPF0201 family)